MIERSQSPPLLSPRHAAALAVLDVYTDRLEAHLAQQHPPAPMMLGSPPSGPGTVPITAGPTGGAAPLVQKIIG